MRKYFILAVAIISLSACEYHELTEMDIDGSRHVFTEDQVTGYYQTQSSFTSSNILATDNSASSPVSVRITVNSNLKGNYVCTTGSNPVAEIFITYDGVQFSTKNNGSSGTIELITSGSNLIEGTFAGTLKNVDNTYTIAVGNGKFSGRAY
jgi:hypothetical protein